MKGEEWFSPEKRADEERREAQQDLIEEFARHPYQLALLGRIVRFMGLTWQVEQNACHIERAQGIKFISDELADIGRLASSQPKK